MRVFFLLTDSLAMDIERARREMFEVKEGVAEICVIACGVNADSVAEILENYPCVSRVYIFTANGTNLGMKPRDGALSREMSVLEPNDRVYARIASRKELEIIASLFGNAEGCDVLLTV